MHVVALSVKELRYTPIGRGFDSQTVSLESVIDIILPAVLCPYGSSASNRNEYQE